jgi:hypothetical protein
VLWSGAPDSSVCHRTVSGAPGPYRVQPATLGKTRARSAIIHRTVRCASRATANSRQRSTLTGEQWSTVPRQKSEQQVRGAPDCPVHHQTVRCHKKSKVPMVDRAPNPNSWVMWRRTRQPIVPVRWCTRLSGAPIAAASPTATLVVEGYKYPQPPQLQASKISEYHIHYKSSSIHS